MSLISTRALSLNIGRPLFSDLNFSLAKGGRLGIVAGNGAGKSALMAVLAGAIEPTAGSVIRARGLSCALVPQDMPPQLAPLSMQSAVASALPPAAAQSEGWRVDMVLDDLAVPGSLRGRALGALSGGWQRYALIARAAVTAPDVYLLDEPTNHLDLSRMGQLQRWIAGLARDVGVIVCAHDRAFLDAVTTSTLFLRAVNSRSFALPYTPARAALDGADLADGRRYESDMARAAQLRRQAAKLKNIGINSGSDLLITKTKQLKDRAAKIENMARPAHSETSAGAIKLSHSGTHAKALLTLDHAQIIAPDGRALFGTGQKWIEPGERVVVLGANGAGKTQLIQAILAAIHASTGAIRAAPSMVLGHMGQNLAELDDKAAPFDLVSRLTGADGTARSTLAGAGIGPDAQGRKISTLSGGQKARLSLLLLRLMRPNFHLLDEPTNHLDIQGQEALQRELCAPGASCLLVSHDRHFVRAVGNRFWQIKANSLQEVAGPEPFFAEMLASRP